MRYTENTTRQSIIPLISLILIYYMVLCERGQDYTCNYYMYHMQDYTLFIICKTIPYPFQYDAVFAVL